MSSAGLDDAAVAATIQALATADLFKGETGYTPRRSMCVAPSSMTMAISSWSGKLPMRALDAPGEDRLT